MLQIDFNAMDKKKQNVFILFLFFGSVVLDIMYYTSYCIINFNVVLAIHVNSVSW